MRRHAPELQRNVSLTELQTLLMNVFSTRTSAAACSRSKLRNLPSALAARYAQRAGPTLRIAAIVRLAKHSLGESQRQRGYALLINRFTLPRTAHCTGTVRPPMLTLP